MKKVSFQEITRRIDISKLPRVDCVVGIGTGGIIPAALIAYKLGCEFSPLFINYRNEENNPIHQEPIILDGWGIPREVKKILLVDDVSVSGKTLQKAKELLGDFEIVTLVLCGKADYVLFAEITECVAWPWKNNRAQEGALCL